MHPFQLIPFSKVNLFFARLVRIFLHRFPHRKFKEGRNWKLYPDHMACKRRLSIEHGYLDEAQALLIPFLCAAPSRLEYLQVRIAIEPGAVQVVQTHLQTAARTILQSCPHLQAFEWLVPHADILHTCRELATSRLRLLNIKSLGQNFTHASSAQTSAFVQNLDRTPHAASRKQFIKSIPFRNLARRLLPKATRASLQYDGLGRQL